MPTASRRATPSVSEADGEDLPVDVSTTGRVAVDGSARSEIEVSGDRDWFAVTLEANRTYRIDLEGALTGAGTLRDPYLRGVHDADGALIAGTTDDDGGEGSNSRVKFTAAEAGTYYVAAGADNDNREGTYTLSVTDVTDGVPDDFAAGTETTGAVAVDGSATGEIETEYDRDWFKVELEAGRIYLIDLEGSETGAGTLRDPYLYGIHDAEGNLYAGTRSDGGGELFNSRVSFTVKEDGTYYVAAGAYGNREGTYTLSVADVDEFEAGTGTTGAVAVGGSARGKINFRGDRDWFAVELDAGSTYLIDLEGSPTGGGTLRDPYLHGIHRADGRRIAGTTDDDGGAGYNSQVEFTAAAAGTYYVAAGGYATHQGTYTLSVEEVM